MKAKRKDLPKEVVRKLEIFYLGKRCAITCLSSNVDWHHLDDNNSNAVFENCIPLSRDFNNKLETYRKYQEKRNKGIIREWMGIDTILNPDRLFDLSREHFANAEPAHAYCCSRLAVFIVKNYFHLEYLFANKRDIYDYIFQALSAARHAAYTILIKDIIERDIVPLLLANKISVYNKVRLLHEFGCIFQEYGNIPTSLIYFSLASEFKKYLSNEEKNQYKIRNLRRQSLINIKQKNKLLDVENMLAEANSLQKSTNIKIANKNALAWKFMAEGNFSKVRDILHPIHEQIFSNVHYDSKIVTPWNALETNLTYYSAIFASEKKNGRAEKGTKEQTMYLLELFSKKNIQLRPLARDLSLSSKGYMNNEVYELCKDKLTFRSDELSNGLIQSIEKAAKILVSFSK